MRRMLGTRPPSIALKRTSKRQRDSILRRLDAFVEKANATAANIEQGS